MKQTISIRLRFSMCLLGMLMGSWMMAQNTISGTVTSSTGEPLFGANIIIKGTSQGTVADLDGKFALQTDSSFPLTLQISYTGFVSEEIELQSTNSNLQVALEESFFLADEVIISASRRPEKVQEAPASVSVITSRILDTSPNDNPIRAIINEPGVFIQQQGAGRVNVQLRGDAGLTNTASFPILDYRSLLGAGLSFLDNLNTPLNNLDIERIEVVRGPGSALYGPGVTAGVVHYISKSPIDKPGTSIELMGGELETYGISVRHATKVSDKFGFKINGVYKRGGEFTFDPVEDADFLATLSTQITAPAITNGVQDLSQPGRVLLDNLDADGDGNPVQDFWETRSVSGNLEFRPQNDLTINISGGANYGSGVFYNNQGTGVFSSTEIWGQARVQKGGFFGQIVLLDNNGGTDDNPTFSYNTGQTTFIARTQVEGQLQYNFDTPNFLNANWTTGFDYRQSNANTANQVYGRNEDNDDFNVYGLYVQTKVELAKDKLDLVLAGRGDRFNFFDDVAFSPRAVFVYKPHPKHTFRAGFNRANASPDQLNLNIDLPVTALPGAYQVWFKGNREAQTFGDNPEIVFNGALPFPNLPIDTPGLPLAFVQQAVGGMLIPALSGGFANDPILGQFTDQISGYLSNPANLVGGTGGQFVGVNLFTREPLGLIEAPKARLRVEDTWEVGYKGLIADKLGVSLDVYNRKVEGDIVFTGISPSYGLQGTDGIPGDLSAGVSAGFAPFLTDLLRPLVGDQIEDEAELQAIVTATTAQVGGAYNAGAAGFLNQIAPFNDNFILATTPTEQVPAFPGAVGAAGYRTFEEYSYWGADLGLNYYVNNDFSIFFNYSWISENRFNPIVSGTTSRASTGLAQPLNRFRVGMNYAPEKGFNGNLSYQNDPSFPVFLGQFSGDSDPKSLFDASLGYTFDTGLSIGVSAQNLFNNEYRTFPGLPKIGRRVVATARYTFGGNKD